MAPSVVEATLIVLDVGHSVSQTEKDELQSFFESSRVCIMKIIERKIFSRPKDLIGLILLGSKQTNNNLALNNDDFQNICVATNLESPTWNLIKTVRDEITTTENEADWIEALLVALDSMENQLMGAKVSAKKIVLFSDLKTRSKADEHKIDEIIDKFKSKNIELILIGPDIWVDEESEPSELIASKSKEQIKNENIIKKIISDLDALTCSFEEAIFQLMYHKNRAVTPYPWNADLCIGPDIAIPISAYIKIKTVQSIGQWKKSYKDPVTNVQSAIVKSKSYFRKEDNTTNVEELDVIEGYVYGRTIVPYTKFDKAMEYESGPRCLTIFGFTKEHNIHWSNLTGDSTMYILPRKGDTNSKIALDALVTTLYNLKLVGIARKVYNKNNAPHMNVIFPIVEDEFKCLSMINLAFKEDYKYMMFPPLNQKKYNYNDDQAKAIDDLIDSMNLSEVDMFGKEHFSIDKTINPSLQHTFDTIAYRALNPENPLPEPRKEIQDLLDVPPSIAKLSYEPLNEVKKQFKLVLKDKTKTGKAWITQELKKEDNIKEHNDTPVPKTTESNPLSALSVVTNQIKFIGTVNPSNDFNELLNYGEPFETLSQQMQEVIEKLVFLSVGSSYSKPLTALKTLREECVKQNPTIFNNWMSQLKVVLLERSKLDFFMLLIEKNLGLITDKENESSDVNENDSKTFLNVPSNAASNPQAMDTTDIDDLFD